MRRMWVIVMLLAMVAAATSALWWRGSGTLDDAAMAARYTAPLPAPNGPLTVFHIGHSLVNRDMPAMLAQLAGEGHHYDSQLGWGATLSSHWGDATISGFELENDHSRFRPAIEAVESGDYDAIVLTEMVEIRSALKYHDSPRYLALWADKALSARPEVRLYLYETWHNLDDPEGWLARLDADLSRYWVDGILRPALADLPADAQIHLIPAGQALAAFVRAIEQQGGVGNLRDRTDLFSRNAGGALDQIHLNDLGNYFVALVHYAVLYQKSPVGLPYALKRGDGSQAVAPAPETALLMQQVVWQTVLKTPLTGVAP
jgi:hypothetical protein